MMTHKIGVILLFNKFIIRSIVLIFGKETFGSGYLSTCEALNELICFCDAHSMSGVRTKLMELKGNIEAYDHVYSLGGFEVKEAIFKVARESVDFSDDEFKKWLKVVNSLIYAKIIDRSYQGKERTSITDTFVNKAITLVASVSGGARLPVTNGFMTRLLMYFGDDISRYLSNERVRLLVFNIELLKIRWSDYKDGLLFIMLDQKVEYLCIREISNFMSQKDANKDSVVEWLINDFVKDKSLNKMISVNDLDEKVSTFFLDLLSESVRFCQLGLVKKIRCLFEYMIKDQKWQYCEEIVLQMANTLANNARVSKSLEDKRSSIELCKYLVEWGGADLSSCSDVKSIYLSLVKRQSLMKNEMTNTRIGRIRNTIIGGAGDHKETYSSTLKVTELYVLSQIPLSDLLTKTCDFLALELVGYGLLDGYDVMAVRGDSTYVVNNLFDSMI